MPVFDTAAAIARNLDRQYGGKAIRLANKNAALVNESLEQEIEMAPEELDLKGRAQDTREGELNVRLGEYYLKASAVDREKTQNGAAAAMAAIKAGEDPFQAYTMASGEAVPEGIDVGDAEQFFGAILASAEQYQKTEAANAEWTSDKNYIESLDSLSREEKDKFLEAIATKKATITGTMPDDPGVFGATTGDKTQDRMTREVVGGTENLLSSIDRIEGQVGSMDQSALGLPGSTSKLIDNMASAVMGFADMLPDATASVGGQSVKESALLDAKLYQDMFSGPAAQSAALQANAIGLAYTLARAANPDGRISDADVRHQMKRVLLGGSSKTQILAAVTEVRREVMVNMANYMRVNKLNQTTKGKEYYDSLMRRVEAIDGPQDIGDEVPLTPEEEEELARLKQAVKQ